jgi:hypothetical protein
MTRRWREMGSKPLVPQRAEPESTCRAELEFRNWCYIETHDEKYCGHFLLRRVDFAPPKLSIELDRPRDNLISVTFAMAATEFAEASQVVKIISGEIEPP